MGKKFWYKLSAAVVCCVMLLAMLPLAAMEVQADDEDTLKDLNSRYEELEAQQTELQNKIDQAKTEKEKQLAIKEKTASEISILKEQINVLNQKITYLETEIANREEEIANLNSDIDENYELFKQRVRSMYMTDNTTTLGLVFGSDSFSEFLTRSEYLKRVAEHDQALIDQLNTDKASVEEAKKALDADREDLEASQTSVEAKKAELDQKLSATEQQIQNISQMEQQFLANKEALQQEMKEVQDEIDAIYAAMDNSGDYVGGSFSYPIPSYRSISSYYGWRFGGTDFHTGVDFPAPAGTPILAPNAGVVSYTKNTYVPGVGYGRYMIVDHGGGYTTLYGHLSAIVAQLGEWVSKGETIAKVGTTGWSTGNHLHFEIRVDGQHQNPLNYLAS